MNNLESQLESPIENIVSNNKIITGEIDSTENENEITISLNVTYNQLKSYLNDNFLPIIKITAIESDFIDVSLYIPTSFFIETENNTQVYNIYISSLDSESSYGPSQLTLSNTSPTSNNWTIDIGAYE